MRIDVIKTFIRKGKMPHVGLMHDRQVADTFAGQFYVFRGEIHAGRDRSVLCKLQQVGSGSASDLEHLLTCMFTKLRHIVEPRICGVALLFG